VTPNPERLVAEGRRVCKEGRTILIPNQANSNRLWWILEQAARRLRKTIGYRPDFDIPGRILKYEWEVRSVRQVNLLGLPRLVEICDM
jgi:hypothetical protein